MKIFESRHAFLYEVIIAESNLTQTHAIKIPWLRSDTFIMSFFFIQTFGNTKSKITYWKLYIYISSSFHFLNVCCFLEHTYRSSIWSFSSSHPFCTHSKQHKYSCLNHQSHHGSTKCSKCFIVLILHQLLNEIKKY